MPDNRYFLVYRLPIAPAKIDPAMLKMPMTEMAIAPSAEVVVMPISARMPPAAMGPQRSVTKAGKWAVMKAS